MLLPAQQLVKRGKENVHRERQNQEMSCPKISSAWGTKTQVRGRTQPGRDTLPRPGHSPSKSLAVSYTPHPIHPGWGSTFTAPPRWSARPRGPGDWLQHSIVAPAASALHRSLPGARSTGGVPGGRSSSSTSRLRAEAASHSLCEGSMSLVLAGIHTHHGKPRGTSLPLDSGRACLASHANKALPHRHGAALPAVKCCQGHRANPAVREQQSCALEACIPWAKTEMRKMLPEDSGRRVKCLYRPDPRAAKSSTRQGPALHSIAS